MARKTKQRRVLEEELKKHRRNWSALQAKLRILENWLEKTGSFPADLKQKCFLHLFDHHSVRIVSSGNMYMMTGFPYSLDRSRWYEPGVQPLLFGGFLEAYHLIRVQPSSEEMKALLQQPTNTTWEEVLKGRSLLFHLTCGFVTP